tara:strand:+ start:895 stop:1209 length:315 start_codon:yes stop_codon:yes gene_type:complete
MVYCIQDQNLFKKEKTMMAFKWFKKVVENTRNPNTYTGDVQVVLTTDDLWEMFRMFDCIMKQESTTEEETAEILKIREKFMDCKGVLKNVITCPDKIEPILKGN